MSDPDFTAVPLSSPARRSEPPILPGGVLLDAPEMGRRKLGLAFVAGLVVGVAGCLVLYFISSVHRLSPLPQGASDRVHVGPFEIGNNSNPASASVVVPDATLSLLPVTSEEQRDDEAIKRFTLHIPIKARPDSHIEARDLVVHVLFYDIIGGQKVVQTSANVNSRWVNPPADWKKAGIEDLAVEYQLPKPKAGTTKPEARKYFGYLVRLYYKDQLQAATAQPERLQRQYPPSPTLPK
ncbi:MAG: hypothetical protein ABJF10_10050 [Chthoniobacter sp.]|uniref:hypothetical protein n=1 Tax=Chthoniobacter sp. TaxID=2510640 RepID=UPI0032A26261